MIIPFIFFFIFLIAYSALTTMVWRHLKEHASPSDPYNWVSLAFLIVIVLFLALSIFLFFSVNWTELLASSLSNLPYAPTGY